MLISNITFLVYIYIKKILFVGQIFKTVQQQKNNWVSKLTLNINTLLYRHIGNTNYIVYDKCWHHIIWFWGRHCHDRMVVAFTTTSVHVPMHSVPISTEVVSSNPTRRGVLDTTLCDKICRWLAAGQWFSQGTPVSSINKTDRHNITEILLKVALSTITLTLLYDCTGTSDTET
jgi:hypothetical protein